MNSKEKEAITDFMALYQNLSELDLLTFTGMVFDYIQNGFVNSENKANAHEVSEDGFIFSSCEFGLVNFTTVSYELVYAANDKHKGSFPQHDFFDSLDCWVQRTKAIDIVEDRFIKLSFKSKLYVIMEIFIHIGMQEIDFNFEQYVIEGYELAEITLRYIYELYPTEAQLLELPF